MLPIFLAPLALALGITLHHAAATPLPTATDSATVAGSKQPVVIEFENQAWDLATVYAVPQSGGAVRLGQVTAGGTARLRVPLSVVADPTTVDIVAVPFARHVAARSGLVTVVPGDVLRASLPPAENIVSVLPGR
jgi:hypothetical protein